MRIGKKLLSVIIIMMLTVSCLSACGSKGKVANSTTDIEIKVWNSGLGTDWLDAVIKGFEAKYPEYKVTYSSSASNSAVMAAFENEDIDTIDLYMSQVEYDTKYLEPLDDVLDSVADGDSKTIREKLNPSYAELEIYPDGKTYALTWGGGTLGIVYNKKLFNQAGVRTIPRTTDELASACDTLAGADIVPTVHYSGAQYWDYMQDAWFVQYDGADYVLNNFYGCTDANGNSPSKEVFLAEDGRYESLKAFEKIITYDYVLQGSNSQNHIVSQTMFLQEEAAMMVNGSWLTNEMESVGSMDDYEVMKTPILSAITKKLTTVKKEMDLRKVITAIDAVVDGEADIATYKDGANYNVDGLIVSAADWDYLYTARNTVPANYCGQNMFIPKYSNAKEAAKTFIKYMYSDEGYKIYADSLHMGLPLSLCEGEIDRSEWNTFEKQLFNLLDKSEEIASAYMKSKHDIFLYGGASKYAGVQFIAKFCAGNESDRLNAASAWENVIKQVNHKYENTWLKNLGE